MRIDDYFEGVGRSLEDQDHVTSIEVPECLASDDYNGLLKVRVWFWDGSYLDLYEVVSTELGYPVRLHYAYTYVSDEQHVFRYDNAPHYPQIVTFPHHRHVGPDEQVAPSEQPSLKQVLSEIAERLSSS
jgi:hypothetical protein